MAKTFQGKTYKEWAKETGISLCSIYNRIHDGWPIEKAVSTPKVPTGTHNLKYDIVGKTFKDRYGHEFIVESFSHRKQNVSYFNVRFVESGYMTKACSSHIRSVGNTHVFDRLSPTVAGVGMMGYAKTSTDPRLFVIWTNMIDRCYNPNNHAYKNYGAIGVTVCERWKRFDLFIEDARKLPGYDKQKIDAGELTIDKDIIDRSKLIYSPETCCFVTKSVNSTDANIRRWSKNKV